MRNNKSSVSSSSSSSSITNSNFSSSSSNSNSNQRLKRTPSIFNSYEELFKHVLANVSEKNIEDAISALLGYLSENKDYRAYYALGNLYEKSAETTNDYSYKALALSAYQNVLKQKSDDKDANHKIQQLNAELKIYATKFLEELKNSPARITHPELFCINPSHFFSIYRQTISHEDFITTLGKAVSLRTKDEHRELNGILKSYTAHALFETFKKGTTLQQLCDKESLLKAKTLLEDVIRNYGGAYGYPNKLYDEVNNAMKKQGSHQADKSFNSKVKGLESSNPLTDKQIGISSRHPNRELNGKSWESDDLNHYNSQGTDSYLFGYSDTPTQPSQDSLPRTLSSDSQTTIPLSQSPQLSSEQSKTTRDASHKRKRPSSTDHSKSAETSQSPHLLKPVATRSPIKTRSTTEAKKIKTANENTNLQLAINASSNSNPASSSSSLSSSILSSGLPSTNQLNINLNSVNTRSAFRSLRSSSSLDQKPGHSRG